LIINIGLVASCWFISLHPTLHDARSQEPKTIYIIYIIYILFMVIILNFGMIFGLPAKFQAYQKLI